jgi:hypothetical protein
LYSSERTWQHHLLKSWVGGERFLTSTNLQSRGGDVLGAGRTGDRLRQHSLGQAIVGLGHLAPMSGKPFGRKSTARRDANNSWQSPPGPLLGLLEIVLKLFT